MTKYTQDKYTKLVRGKSAWVENDIRGFIKLLNAIRFKETQRDEQAENLKNSMGTYPITKEQTKKGINYLRTRYFKLNGEPRKSCPFREREIHVIRNFKRFLFVGVYEEYNDYGYGPFYHPIYRVIAKDGSTFEYVPVHWGTPLIVG